MDHIDIHSIFFNGSQWGPSTVWLENVNFKPIYHTFSARNLTYKASRLATGIQNMADLKRIGDA